MKQGQTIHTLKKRADFVTLNRKGRKWVSHGLVMQTLPNDLGVIRVGYTITKKTEISAVKRNRIKRRLRAAVAATMAEHASSGHDYVLIGKQMTATRPFESLCGDVKWCLEKLGCVKA